MWQIGVLLGVCVSELGCFWFGSGGVGWFLGLAGLGDLGAEGQICSGGRATVGSAVFDCSNVRWGWVFGGYLVPGSHQEKSFFS